MDDWNHRERAIGGIIALILAVAGVTLLAISARPPVLQEKEVNTIPVTISPLGQVYSSSALNLDRSSDTSQKSPEGHSEAVEQFSSENASAGANSVLLPDSEQSQSQTQTQTQTQTQMSIQTPSQTPSQIPPPLISSQTPTEKPSQPGAHTLTETLLQTSMQQPTQSKKQPTSSKEEYASKKNRLSTPQATTASSGTAPFPSTAHPFVEDSGAQSLTASLANPPSSIPPLPLSEDHPLPSVKDPEKIMCSKRPPPLYPPTARRLGAEGTVVVRVTLEKNGTVSAAEIDHSRTTATHPSLLEAALTAVKQWQCTFPSNEDRIVVFQPFRFQLRAAR